MSFPHSLFATTRKNSKKEHFVFRCYFYATWWKIFNINIKFGQNVNGVPCLGQLRNLNPFAQAWQHFVARSKQERILEIYIRLIFKNLYHYVTYITIELIPTHLIEMFKWYNISSLISIPWRPTNPLHVPQKIHKLFCIFTNFNR